jgi:hypothetical protein
LMRRRPSGAAASLAFAVSNPGAAQIAELLRASD